MSSEYCHRCAELVQKAGLAIKEHLEATARWTLAMQKDTPEAELSALEESAHIASAARRQAVLEYKHHVASHAQTQTAGK